MDAELKASFDKWEASLDALCRYLLDTAAGVGAEVPALTCSKAEQDTSFPTADATTMALVQEAHSELVLVPATLHDSSSPTIIGKETLEVDTSTPTGFISMAPMTCSTDCLPQQSSAALLLFASASSTLTEYGLNTNNVCVAAVPRSIAGVFPAVLAPTSQLQQVYDDNGFFMPSSSRRISSTVPVHRPQPWPSFITDHAPGDETLPQPWTLFSVINGREFPRDAEVCVLSGGLQNHVVIHMDTICNISPTIDNHWSCKTSSRGILIHGHHYNVLLFDALGRIEAWEVDATWSYKGRSVVNASGINLTMSWDPGQQLTNEDTMGAFVLSSVPCCDTIDASSLFKHIHILIPTGGIRCAANFSLLKLLHMLIHYDNSWVFLGAKEPKEVLYGMQFWYLWRGKCIQQEILDYNSCNLCLLCWYLHELQLARIAREGAALNRVVVNRNLCQLKWPESIHAYPADMTPYCSSFSSASEGISCKSKLERNNWLAYMMEQYTGMHSSGIKTGLYFLCISTSTPLKQNRYVAYGLLILFQSSPLKYMDVRWFTTAILTAIMNIVSVGFFVPMDAICSVQPDLLLTQVCQLTSDPSEESCCCVLVSLNLHITISLADIGSLGWGTHQAVFGSYFKLHISCKEAHVTWIPWEDQIALRKNALHMPACGLLFLQNQLLPTWPPPPASCPITSNMFRNDELSSLVICELWQLNHQDMRQMQIAWPSLQFQDASSEWLVCTVTFGGRQGTFQGGRHMSVFYRHKELRWSWDPGGAAEAFEQGSIAVIVVTTFLQVSAGHKYSLDFDQVRASENYYPGASFDWAPASDECCSYPAEAYPNFGYYLYSGQIKDHRLLWDPGGFL